MKKTLTIEEQLKKMAEHLINRVLEPDKEVPPTIAEETAAFKAVSSYWAMVEKGKPPSEDDDSPFNKWRENTNKQDDHGDEITVSSAARANGRPAGLGRYQNAGTDE